MVPVPEEHVQEAMALILRLTARANLEPWDLESVGTLFNSVDEPTRSVLSAVSRATLAKGAVPDTEASASIEMTQREVLGICRELNEQAQEHNRPGLVVVKQENEVLPNGRSRERRMLSIDRTVAELVREVEREELASSAGERPGPAG